MSTDKEKIYDAEISPLMAQIIAIAKRANINMFADFSLDVDADNDGETLFCTTSLHDIDKADEHGIERMSKYRSIATARPRLFAFTMITSTPPKEKP